MLLYGALLGLLFVCVLLIGRDKGRLVRWVLGILSAAIAVGVGFGVVRPDFNPAARGDIGEITLRRGVFIGGTVMYILLLLLGGGGYFARYGFSYT